MKHVLKYLKESQMKNSFIIIVSFIIFFGCSKDDDTSNKLVGNWVLIETYNSDGGSPGSWNEVSEEDSYFINLTEALTFTSDKFSECTAGIYIKDEVSFSLIFGCDGFTAGIENPPGTFKENYYFENSNLIVTPNYLNCDEGCLYKFKKIVIEE